MSASSNQSATAQDGGLPEGFRRRLLRQLLLEFGPLLAFFGTFWWFELEWAAVVYAAAAVLVFAISWRVNGQLPVLPSISALLLAVFATLTLTLGNTAFIKIQPTVLNGFYALVLGVGWQFGYRLAAKVLAPDIGLDDEGLRKLTVRATAYLVALAILNEVVWRSMTTEAWLTFKVFGIITMNMLFAWWQFALVKAHLRSVGHAD